jgi:hypothetical protein
MAEPEPERPTETSSREDGSSPQPAEVAGAAPETERDPAKASERPPAGAPPSVKPPDAGPLGAYEALALSAKLPDLVALTLDIVGAAAAARRTEVSSPSKVQNHVELAHLTRASADTPFGNALKVLELGPEGEAERALARALWAHAVAEAPRKRPEDEDRLAADVLWLATHTPYDATPLLDRALGEEAADLWAAIADRVKRIDEGRGAALGRAEALVGCAAIVASTSPVAEKLCGTLAGQLRDPVLVRLLGTTSHQEGGEIRLDAQLVATPRGPIVTTLLALTGILFVLRGGAAVARLALAYRTPTQVSLSPARVRVTTRVEMLGRTLRERELVIGRDALVRVVREVRYPRASFYAGLLALAAGSYVGVRAFVDGVRAASPSLLVVGLTVVALGVLADFVLGSLLPGSRGRCRLAFVPRTGPAIWLGDVDARRADEVLVRALGVARATIR